MMVLSDVRRVLAAGLCCAIAALGIGSAAHGKPTPMPSMIAAPNDAQPYGSNDPGMADLAAKGYVQEEFFISGTIGADLPYTTRILVRRPADPAKFSGIVIAESIRSSGVRSMWMEAPYMLSRGHAYVEIGSNRSVNTLVKQSNPARYAALNVPDPTARKLVFGHVQEIAAQAGLLLRANLPDGPFRGMRVRHVILAGCSEQGMFVRLYMRDTHPVFRTADGKSIYDGYFPACVGDWPPILAREDGSPLPNFTQPPVEVPTIMLATSEPEGYPQDGRLYRRPDANSRSDKFRLYEVAAMPHGLDMRMFMRPGLTLNCNGPKARSNFPGAYPANAALDNLIRWVDKGIPAPRAPRLDVASATGPVLRDEFGNPRGGVRTTALDVPVAAHRLCDTGKPNTINPVGIDFGAAYVEPFTPDQLKRLYPTPQVYLAKVDRRLKQLVRQRWYLPEDADEARAKAAEFAKSMQ